MDDAFAMYNVNVSERREQMRDGRFDPNDDWPRPERWSVLMMCNTTD
jgi:hypothetical protein